MSISNKTIQQILAHYNFYSGAIDGILGKNSNASIDRVLFTNRRMLPNNYSSWNSSRKAIAAIQSLLKSDNLYSGNIDGFYGHLTDYAIDNWEYIHANGSLPAPWRPDDEPELNLKNTNWGSQRDMEKRYGPAGGSQCSSGIVRLPFPLKLAWDLNTTINSFKCHEAVADSASRAYSRVASEYSPAQIEQIGLNIWGGCYNYRNKRGGSSLSTHAYGLAIDTDPIRNQLRWKKDRARLAKPDAEAWFKIWKEEGWTSLGKVKDFDWMHIQAVSL